MVSFKWCNYDWKCEMEGGRKIDPNSPYYWFDIEQIKINEDNSIELYIENNKEKDIKHWDGKTYHPTVACGLMRSIQDFGYGEFSVELMLPEGYNLWPSFWLSGSGNWPPEIDIMEGWSCDNSYYHTFIPQFPYICPSWKTTTNVHYNDKNMNKKSTGSRSISILKQPKNPSYNFIEYKCIWKPDEILFFANGKEIRKVKKDVAKDLTENIKNKEKGWKMNVIFNVWPEEIDVNLLTPMKIKNFKYKPL